MSEKKEIIEKFEDLLKRAGKIVKRNEIKNRLNEILAKINGVLAEILITIKDNGFSLTEQQNKYFLYQLDKYQKELHELVDGFDKKE